MTHFNKTKEYTARKNNLVFFFPGLGSRGEYQNIGDILLRSENSEIKQIYREAAIAMGYGEHPEKMLISPATLPAGKMERQGFIGASFLTHNLVLAAQLREKARQKNQDIHVLAYSGESFGIINSAVASGALNIGDGVKIANFFTPYILLASDKQDDKFSHTIASYYPTELKEQNLIPEPYYVVALRGRNKQLTDVYAALQDEFLSTEIEKHKIYSHNQINLYVKTSIKSCFDIFMKNHQEIEVIKLKEPTVFLTHSAQLAPLRRGLEKFLLDQKIVFQDPHTPVIANHCEQLMTTKEEIKSAILAIIEQVMFSETTAKMADSFDADAIIELGLGNKSVQLLRDNNINTPALSFTGDSHEAELILRALNVLCNIRENKNVSQICSGIVQWLAIARDHTKLSLLLAPKIEGAIKQIAKLQLAIIGNAPVSIDSLYKNSWRYRDSLQPGELVMLARVRRNILGTDLDKNQVYADLKILTSDGTIRYQKTPFITHTERTLFYFSSLNDLSNVDVFNSLQDMETAPFYQEICLRIGAERNQGEPVRRLLQLRAAVAQPETQVIRRIMLQMLTFELMKTHRPGLVQQNNTYLVTRDFIGWLACLVAAGAASFDSVVLLCRDYYSTLGRKISPMAVARKFTSELTDAHFPVLSVNGLPLLSRRDLEVNTFKMLLGDFPTENIQVALDCHLSVITLDGQLNDTSLKTIPYHSDIILINSPQDIWLHNPELVLEQREREAQIYLTEEYCLVSDYAKRRNLLCSTINSYIEVDEVPVQFCSGGSESMTMFIQRTPNEPVVVRKILSEALTAAKWKASGKGVMLPPFAKAARQVDYLRALPDALKPWFPQVYSVTKRKILTPISQERVGKTTCKEVIYEMSLVEGEEVSQFIQRNTLAPQIIARLYEIIFIFLRDHVHSSNRVKISEQTLETSYFRKIEDRLALCRQTAPQSFGPELLDSEKIVINGYEYLNTKALLRTFRAHPEYQRLLEPKYHSLIMGDTNTENIKIGNTAPLLSVQALINQQSSEEDIIKALADISAENIQLKFLDPRAIGYKSEGADCRDDYMYDNKPWHNSIGHYDEIHNEMFTIDMNSSPSNYPIINIKFSENNAYQQAYLISDCAQNNVNPLHDPMVVGMEKFFAQVMNSIYESTNPDSIYLREDPHWLVRFVFMMGTHFTAMPPFHFSSELDGTIKDSILTQRRPVAIYCEGIKWLNWALEILQGKRDQFLGVDVPFIEHIVKDAI